MGKFDKIFRTEQEKFWAYQFGDEYINRNKGEQLLASYTALLARIFPVTRSVRRLIEFGPNIGLNLKAARRLLPEVELTAVEINAEAVNKLKLIDNIVVHHQSILDFEPSDVWDFVLIAGVLIHMQPAVLPQVYDTLYQCSSRYICVSEYYNPTPVEIEYHGHKGKLFKRDFAGEMLSRFKDLRLLDYGFVYRRDNNFSIDDVNWFLLEKSG